MGGKRWNLGDRVRFMITCMTRQPPPHRRHGRQEGGENGHTTQPGKHQEPSRRQATMDLEMLGVVSLHDEVLV